MSDTPQSSINTAKYWQDQLISARKRSENFVNTANAVYDRFELDKQTDEFLNDNLIAPRSNILWSNVKLEKPALYSRVPKIVTKVKYDQSDQVAKVASQLLEDNLDFQITDDDSFDSAINEAVQDFLLSGRGVTKVEYKSEISENTIEQIPVFPTEDPNIFINGDNQQVDISQVTYDKKNNQYYYEVEYESLLKESVYFEHIDYSRFHYSNSRTWDRVNWISFDHYLEKHEVEEKFGKSETGKQKPNLSKIQYTHNINEGHNKQQEPTYGDQGKQCQFALIVEIWDKVSKKVRFLAPDSGMNEFLHVMDPPVKFKGFFPVPRPLINNKTPRSLTGRPDFIYYSSHARELDTLCFKRYILQDALRIAGVYDESMKDLKNILKGNRNKLIPVNMPKFIQGGGFQASVQLLPLDMISKQIQELLACEQSVIDRIYQISGIADIIRGQSDPNETATAQQIKGQFATLRISEKQSAVQNYAKDLANLAGEIIAEVFSPETIQTIGQSDSIAEQEKQLIPNAIQLLKNDGLRRIRVGVETDSTIALDENIQKQQLNEYITSISNFIRESMPFVQTMPFFGQFIAELLLKTSRTYRLGRALESALQQAIAGLLEQLSAPPPEPQQDPRIQIELQKLQLDQKKLEDSTMLEIERLKQARDQLASDITLRAEQIRQDWDIERFKANKELDDTAKQIMSGRVL